MYKPGSPHLFHLCIFIVKPIDINSPERGRSREQSPNQRQVPGTLLEIRRLCACNSLKYINTTTVTTTCHLISPKQAGLVAADCMPSRSLIKLLNASSIDQSVLRPSLLPNMLYVAKHNIDREAHSIAGFEVGRVHFQTKKGYLEPTVISILLTGKRAPHHWDTKPGDVDFYDLKGIIENFCDGLKIEKRTLEISQYENFHPGRQEQYGQEVERIRFNLPSGS